METASPWLGRVKLLEPAALDQCRRIRFERLAQQAVENSCADALPRRVLHFLDQCKESIDIFARRRGRNNTGA